jgi:hypothetical protein
MKDIQRMPYKLSQWIASSIEPDIKPSNVSPWIASSIEPDIKSFYY